MKRFVLENNFLKLVVLDYGATIQQLHVPDKNGQSVNIAVGFEADEAYLDNPFYMGSSVGRYAGRIRDGKFSLNGEIYNLHHEDGVHLHGGKNGLDKKIWVARAYTPEAENPSLTLSVTSPHLEEGYPGTLEVLVTYTLENSNLRILYTAVTDQLTVINLTNHAYFNLEGSGNVLDQELWINSNAFLELDAQLLPTGKFHSIEGTSYDFRAPQIIGKKAGFEGIDDVFLLNDARVAYLSSPKTGIRMEVTTNQPAVVIFTPKNLGNRGYTGSAMFSDYPAICFETQGCPDSPNNPHFPSSLLHPGEVYKNESVFGFSIQP